jgi:hypothetical protein
MKKKSKSAVTFCVFIILFVLTSSWTFFAKEFWESKAYQQWNEQEAMAMLANSPWTRPTVLPGNYGGIATPRVATLGGTNSGGDLAKSQGFGGSDSVPLYIRWFSSTKVREAMCRMTQLRGALTEEQAAQFLKQPMPDYVIGISSPGIEPFNQLTFDTVKSATFLLSKKDKSKKIELKSYVPPKDRQDNFAVYMFPKSIDGKPTVELADDEIIFVTQVGKSKIQVNFKLTRMMVDGNLDL